MRGTRVSTRATKLCTVRMNVAARHDCGAPAPPRVPACRKLSPSPGRGRGARASGVTTSGLRFPAAAEAGPGGGARSDATRVAQLQLGPRCNPDARRHEPTTVYRMQGHVVPTFGSVRVSPARRRPAMGSHVDAPDSVFELILLWLS